MLRLNHPDRCNMFQLTQFFHSGCKPAFVISHSCQLLPQLVSSAIQFNLAQLYLLTLLAGRKDKGKEKEAKVKRTEQTHRHAFTPKCHRVLTTKWFTSRTGSLQMSREQVNQSLPSVCHLRPFYSSRITHIKVLTGCERDLVTSTLKPASANVHQHQSTSTPIHLERWFNAYW